MIEVRVPGTSANFGPGFDCLGIALTLYNRFTFEEIDRGAEFSGFAAQYANEENLVYRAFAHTLKELGKSPQGVRMGIAEAIPISRGLGSSAACLVAGVAGASEWVGGGLSGHEIFQIASALEGHPDNVAPAVFGGMTVSAKTDRGFCFQELPIAAGLKFYGVVPDFTLSTAEARQVLPEQIPYWDGVHNVGRTALLIASLMNGEFNLLESCLDDRLHQPYRGNLIPGFEGILKKSMELGAYGSFLSGAGPTIMVLAPVEDAGFSEKLAAMVVGEKQAWRVLDLDIDFEGLKIERN